MDKVKWRNSKVFLKHAEYLIGRVYRYFLDSKKITIRLAAYDVSGKSIEKRFDENARANDPLYLMKGTSADEYLKQPAFDLVGDEEFKVNYKGKKTTINIKYSASKTATREAGGASKLGKHAARNVGISLLRANRELELDKSFVIGYDPVERWWGLEVHFDPELDDVFGVTNNKQSAIHFGNHDMEADATNEEISFLEYKKRLEENEDPMLIIYELSIKINSVLSLLRDQVRRMGLGKKSSKDRIFNDNSAEGMATRAIQARRELLGDKVKSKTDEAEKLSKSEKEKALIDVLTKEGVDKKDAIAITEEAIRTKLKVLFQSGAVSGGAFFDVKPAGGTNFITINSKHPLSKHLFELYKEDDSVDTPAVIALKLMLAAWARLEDRSG